MTDYLKVEGHEHLVRDMGSTGNVNTNRDAYMAAVERSRNAQKQKNELRDATREINSLKSEMHEIKSLLKELVGNNNGD